MSIFTLQKVNELLDNDSLLYEIEIMLEEVETCEALKKVKIIAIAVGEKEKSMNRDIFMY